MTIVWFLKDKHASFILPLKSRALWRLFPEKLTWDFKKCLKQTAAVFARSLTFKPTLMHHFSLSCSHLGKRNIPALAKPRQTTHDFILQSFAWTFVLAFVKICEGLFWFFWQVSCRLPALACQFYGPDLCGMQIKVKWLCPLKVDLIFYQKLLLFNQST